MAEWEVKKAFEEWIEPSKASLTPTELEMMQEVFTAGWCAGTVYAVKELSQKKLKPQVPDWTRR